MDAAGDSTGSVSLPIRGSKTENTQTLLLQRDKSDTQGLYTQALKRLVPLRGLVSMAGVAVVRGATVGAVNT
ncbi:hypothetical protein EYF80_043517 [Liparis tanakae]|uniref:Uncharacterized protein n=1 Tax=Liparis tanakae TaxID=230148 RepID=A0A4Z2FYG4_9TELE|nr:hypothetical protein EYF80_043517 [Liparis tanakae]